MLTVTNPQDHPPGASIRRRNPDFIGLACHVIAWISARTWSTGSKGTTPKPGMWLGPPWWGAERAGGREMSDDGDRDGGS